MTRRAAKLFAKRGWKKCPSQPQGTRAYKCVCGDWHLGKPRGDER